MLFIICGIVLWVFLTGRSAFTGACVDRRACVYIYPEVGLRVSFNAALEQVRQSQTSALEEAVSVLDEATKDHKGSLLSVKREVQTFEQGEHSSASVALSRAIELGEKLLSKGDANFLRKLLGGDVPHAALLKLTSPDVDKRNKKATFKMKYKASSGKILKIFADMLKTYEDNHSKATEKEAERTESFKKLNEAKKEELSRGRDA